MVKLGTAAVAALRLGVDEITRAYLGENLVFDAVPAAPVYTVTATIDPPEAGAVTGVGQYQEGAAVTLTVTVNDGYTFTGWQENGQTVSTDNPYTFTAAGDRVLNALFSVKKPSRLPDGYTEVAYIEANGCYVDTSLSLTSNTQVVVDIETLSAPASTDGYIAYGCRFTGNTGNWSNFIANWVSNSTGAGVLGSIGPGRSVYKVVDSNKTPRRMKIAMNSSAKTITVDNKTVNVQSSTGTMWAFGTIFLFGMDSSTTPGYLHARLYSCQISQGGTAARDFVPCTNPSGVAGLYDLIGKEFYAKTGNGSLTAGPAA